ncbi:hypothetical protein FACS189449_06900 [Alphaproteobacteria bacterium]|nr:hypothetical protein FACS189449_06900 [Alphaproteobacteria bacterium]
MKLIFDWSSSFHEEKNSWRGDEQMISLEIIHRECGFASAKVIIFAKSTEFLANKKYAKIGIQKSKENNNIETIFSGRLVSFPIGLGNSCLKLEFISEPDNYQDQLNDFCRTNLEQRKIIDQHKLLDSSTNFDELFFSSKDINNPTVFLEGDRKVFYWNMKNGKLSLSDINHGTKNFEANQKHIIQNSFRVKLFREPYKNINISIGANWVQHLYGCIDLYPLIAANFKNSIVSSYTDIGTAMENICEFSGNSGYELANCKIKRISPVQNAHFFSFPQVSREFVVEKSASKPKMSVRFKRFYFEGRMLINWHYKQKRKENITLKVVNTKVKHGREKDVHIKLNSLQLPKEYQRWNYFCYYGCCQKVLHGECLFECVESHISEDKFDEAKWKFLSKIPDALPDESASSFFGTDRGKNAIRYAVQKAIALINYSSRYVEIDFSVCAKDFMDTTLDDQVTLIDNRFPGGSICGKITKIVFFADCDCRTLNITICCNLDGLNEIPPEKLNEYFHQLQIANDTPKMNKEDIVMKISVANMPEEQEELLSKIKAKTPAELKSELRKYPTKIKIMLHPLSTMRVITKDYQIPDILV